MFEVLLTITFGAVVLWCMHFVILSQNPTVKVNYYETTIDGRANELIQNNLTEVI